MSEVKQEALKPSLLDQLKIQRVQFIQQRDFTQNNLNQVIGAIYACDIMIEKHEAEAFKQPAGDQGNVEADSGEKEQAA